jgi:enolase
MSKISKIIGRQILDSRGNPTVEAEVHLSSGEVGVAAVPSGASTGSLEALELRDLDKSYYMGKSVRNAVANINETINSLLNKHDVFDQKGLDYKMIEADGSENKKNLGANSILAVSLAAARAGALASKLPLYRYLSEKLLCPKDYSAATLPTPLMNIINGGAHAANNLDVQEFMIVPHLKKSFAENLRAGVEVFHSLKKVLESKGHSTNVGDEGGFAPNLQSHEEAMECIMKSIELAGYKPGIDISLSLDVASSEFYKNGLYEMEGKKLKFQDMIEYFSTIMKKFPIYSIEDGLAEQDHEGWKALTKELGSKVMLVGDDLFVTNKKIFAAGIKAGEANAILIKVNQIGSLTETFETLELGFKNKYKAIISHRSGETGDHFIADLAVASGAGHIKTGSASRSDRMEKYNQLLRIEESLGNKASYQPVR